MEYIKKIIVSWKKKTKKEVGGHRYIYLILSSVLLLVFFTRIYRLNDLLMFNFDQGRDALVIWDLWHKGDFFLIGPVTGLKGIFLGPFYYYLIAPFYLLGGGNPLIPAYFLVTLSVVAVFMMYFLGKKMHSNAAGIIAAILGGFSSYIFNHSRWLSNPNPILLTSLILIWSMWEILDSKKKSEKNVFWVVAAFFIGVSLHFEAASAVFYIPVFLVFFVYLFLRGLKENKWRKFLPNLKILMLSFIAFFLTLVPQLIFNFRNDNILFNNFGSHFVEEKGFGITKFLIEERSKYFWGLATNIFIPERQMVATVILISLMVFTIFFAKKFRKGILPLFCIFIITPVVGYTYFRGNYAVLYGYYMSGYFMPYLLFLSIILGELFKSKLGKLATIVIISLFLIVNGSVIRKILIDERMGPIDITFRNQMDAVNWVFEDALELGKFNTDFYVPPVISHSYKYLFLWQANQRCSDSACGMSDELVSDLYTLYEADPPHPERLEAWLERQKGIGKVVKQESFGGITVQKRERL
ncbi:glycosyltransferase family 39 protein [Candidatus Woesebacteria bacterium]|nr:glycosyltransferase family 39 protein [Candidatus Woesebacteria bacterium]